MSKKNLPIDQIALPRDSNGNIIYTTGDPKQYGALINNLYTRVESLKKEVSYLDFYNITGAVTDELRFSEQLSGLPLNQSLVINTAPFYYGGQSYSTGDILVKTASSEIIHIKAQTGGVFFPEKITKTVDANGNDLGNYNIHFAYQGASPTLKEDVATSSDTGWTSKFAQTIKYTNLTSATNSGMYSV
jgi:hypothetical protein